VSSIGKSAAAFGLTLVLAALRADDSPDLRLLDLNIVALDSHEQPVNDSRQLSEALERGVAIYPVRQVMPGSPDRMGATSGGAGATGGAGTGMQSIETLDEVADVTGGRPHLTIVFSRGSPSSDQVGRLRFFAFDRGSNAIGSRTFLLNASRQ